ncbi:superoxide dismutase [Cu-Zn]-like [Anopheles stephensi]|uniref:superoxide dismutase [Cu-Zn]-like n=1 Tax=Anopheles stephensi TaxID=30069 RepID=UPI001658B669|nr:superoxide dismutase [Cu-Zn]-like [Anopheles stephensi]
MAAISLAKPNLLSPFLFFFCSLFHIGCNSGRVPVSRFFFFLRFQGSSVAITGAVEGLRPGKHGFHIHEFGDFSRGCLSTGPHYNPDGNDHGAPDDCNSHAGDLGNIMAYSTGLAKVQIAARKITLAGDRSIIGRTLSITEFEDDLGRGRHDYSKTTGNSGNCIACAIIGVAREEYFAERLHLTTDE